MRWTDVGYILDQSPYEERHQLITVFTHQYGKYRAISYQKKSYEIGSYVKLEWGARTPEALGSWYAIESFGCIAARILSRPLELIAFRCSINLLKILVADRSPALMLYAQFSELLKAFSSRAVWYREYLAYELSLLQESGWTLQYERCVVTNKPDVFYLSPKTGQGVCYEIGAPYQDRLLLLPRFWLEESKEISVKDLYDSLKITGHFLEKIHPQTVSLRKNFLSFLKKIIYKNH